MHRKKSSGSSSAERNRLGPGIMHPEEVAAMPHGVAGQCHGRDSQGLHGDEAIGARE